MKLATDSFKKEMIVASHIAYKLMSAVEMRCIYTAKDIHSDDLLLPKRIRNALFKIEARGLRVVKSLDNEQSNPTNEKLWEMQILCKKLNALITMQKSDFMKLDIEPENFIKLFNFLIKVLDEIKANHGQLDNTRRNLWT